MGFRFKDNRKISMGTDKWLDLEMWEDTQECFRAMRERGYRIAVTHIAADTVGGNRGGVLTLEGREFIRGEGSL